MSDAPQVQTLTLPGDLAAIRNLASLPARSVIDIARAGNYSAANYMARSFRSNDEGLIRIAIGDASILDGNVESAKRNYSLAELRLWFVSSKWKVARAAAIYGRALVQAGEGDPLVAWLSLEDAIALIKDEIAHPWIAEDLAADGIDGRAVMRQFRDTRGQLQAALFCKTESLQGLPA
jgi:AraC-like DNA-binding protein